MNRESETWNDLLYMNYLCSVDSTLHRNKLSLYITTAFYNIVCMYIIVELLGSIPHSNFLLWSLMVLLSY